jgi:cytochrome b subunit of formate dehydrogenase
VNRPVRNTDDIGEFLAAVAMLMIAVAGIAVFWGAFVGAEQCIKHLLKIQ